MWNEYKYQKYIACSYASTSPPSLVFSWVFFTSFLKNINDGAKNWEIIDNKRPTSGQNPADDILFPDTSDAESASQTDRLVDFVSNGIKIRGNSGQLNGNGNKFIYLAFAEASLVGSNNVPANAR